MRRLWAERAFLETGWARDVAVDVGEDGRVAAVTADTPARPGDECLAGRVLLPAPGNLHSHAFQRAVAGLTEVRSADGDSFWTWRRLMYDFLGRLTPDHIQAIAAMVQVEMLEAGYAAVGEFHYVHHQAGGEPYADRAETAARICAAAAETGMGLTLLPVLYTYGGTDQRPLEGGQLRFRNDRDGFAALMESARRAVDAGPRDWVLGMAPHSLRAVTPDLLSGAVSDHGPDSRGGPIHIHIAEQTREVVEVEAWLGARPVAWLLGNQPVDDRWCLVHATHMEPAETEGLARSGAVAGLCPITEADLGDGLFDGPRFLAAGGAFGIGSDSNVRIALAEELRLLEYGQRLRDRARNVLAPGPGSVGRSLFRGALAGGARALGRDAGVLAPGRWADLVAIDGDATALHGLDGDVLLDAWIFAADDRVVRDVWSAGRHVVRQGRHRRRDAVEAAFRAALVDLRADPRADP
ncbi:MAG: formimidoylglutamate deiminase [Hyphomicrobiales bacterium]|nr:formimidoylglutamate deiminase [Hyphomicrobiales bacterium]MCP5372268.1 formimidoylglutamate deiminase [Hyphomicrobiales bacterium]